MNVAAIVLAAGNSSRLRGPNKQLVPLAGEPLIHRAVRQLSLVPLASIFVVTGFDAPAVGAALAGLPCDLVHNPDWASGMGSSLAAGVRAATADLDPPDAFLVALPDQIRIDAAHFAALIRAATPEGTTIAATAYRPLGGVSGAQVLGAPAVFKRFHGPELMALPPSGGAKSLFVRHAATFAAVVNSAAEVDLDTPDDLERLAAGSC
jgi:molybdenum cofactor cytidylyltransferase